MTDITKIYDLEHLSIKVVLKVVEKPNPHSEIHLTLGEMKKSWKSADQKVFRRSEVVDIVSGEMAKLVSGAMGAPDEFLEVDHGDTVEYVVNEKYLKWGGKNILQ